MEIGDIFRKIYDLFLHRPMNFSFVDEYVCASARIMSKSDVKWLKQRGVKAILSLTENPVQSTWLGGSGIEYLHVPVRNHRAPTLDQLEACVNFVQKNVENGSKTLIHCAAGKGRTGTVIAAYLCVRENIPAEVAIEQIRAKRSGSVEKDQDSGQESAVIDYCKLLDKNRHSKTA